MGNFFNFSQFNEITTVAFMNPQQKFASANFSDALSISHTPMIYNAIFPSDPRDIYGEPLTNVNFNGVCEGQKQMTEVAFYEQGGFKTEAPNINMISATGAFRNCSSLIGPPFKQPDSLRSIDSMYEECRSLTGEAQIGRNVHNLSAAYKNCSSLTSVNYTLNTTTWSESHILNINYAFANCGALQGTFDISNYGRVCSRVDGIETCFQGTQLTGMVVKGKSKDISSWKNSLAAIEISNDNGVITYRVDDPNKGGPNLKIIVVP